MSIMMAIGGGVTAVALILIWFQQLNCCDERGQKAWKHVAILGIVLNLVSFFLCAFYVGWRLAGEVLL